MLAAQALAIRASRLGLLERLEYSQSEWQGLFSLWGVPTLYNEVVTTYRALIPSIDAVLVPGPRSDPKSVRTARDAARALSAARGQPIPVFCLRRSPGADAVVPLGQC
jgi:hypothetical protein